MKVDKHISELLYEHDCVIVPQLGGFVANYAPAKIHPTQHTFTPPSKNIVFNKSLVNNDGLLANHIATIDNTGYPQALQTITEFVDAAQIQLKKGARVKVDEVGTLYLDVERNIQFEPGTVNYLLDAFGLSQFQSPAIKRDSIGKRIEKEFKDRDAIPAERKKINIKRYVALALAIPVMLGMVWIPLKTDMLRNMNYSDLNPFSSKEAVKYKIREKTNAKPLKEEDFLTIPLLSENDTSKYLSIKLTEHSSPITVNMTEGSSAAVVPDTTKVASNSVIIDADLKFHLVTGCFQIHDNAINFVRTLQEQDISASIIGQNDDGLYVVSCGDYSSRKEASNQLQQLRKLRPDAWLYKK